MVSAPDIRRSEGEGCRAIPLAKLDAALPAFRLIINTVPALILGREKLEKLADDALVLDLASKPGGDDAGDRSGADFSACA